MQYMAVGFNLKVVGKLFQIGLGLRGIGVRPRVQLDEEQHCTCTQPIAEGGSVALSIRNTQQQAAGSLDLVKQLPTGAGKLFVSKDERIWL